MGKATTFLVIMTGLMLLFFFLGLLQETPNTTLLNLLIAPENMATSVLQTQLFIVLSLEGLVALAVGIIARDLELGLLGAYTIFLFNLLWDFIAVFNVFRNANPVFAVIIFAPLFFVWFTTLMEFWRGTD